MHVGRRSTDWRIRERGKKGKPTNVPELLCQLLTAGNSLERTAGAVTRAKSALGATSPILPVLEIVQSDVDAARRQIERIREAVQLRKRPHA